MNPAWTITALAAAALATAACAGNEQRPDEDFARAEAGIRQAERSGAEQYGALELQSARDKLERARAAANQEGDMAAARRLAEQAALDAELAAAKTSSRKAELALKEVEDSIAALREEMQRDRRRAGDLP